MGSGAERSVMMEAVPCSTFKVIEAQFALHLLVVAFDPPTKFRETHQVTHRSRRRK
jgi:hypothetical protein